MPRQDPAVPGRTSGHYLADRGSKKRLARITVRAYTPLSFWIFVLIAIVVVALAVPWITKQHEQRHDTRTAPPR
jgi:hypothetical protein